MGKIITVAYERILYPPFKMLAWVRYPKQQRRFGTHVHNEFQTIFVLQGSLTFTTQDGDDGSSVCGKADDVLIVPPEMLHESASCDKCQAIQLLHSPMTLQHYGELFPLFGQMNEQIRKIALPGKDSNSLCRAIIGELMEPTAMSSVTLHAALMELFVTAVRHMPPPTSSELYSEQTVQRAIHHIEKHYMTKISLAELAAHCNLSVSRFAHLFRQCTGQTPMQYVIERKLAQAEILLGFTDHPMAEIAEKLGFSSIHYFSRSFKRYRHLSPLAFRRLSRGQPE
jgi:AraC-like DNA-binding protein